MNRRIFPEYVDFDDDTEDTVSLRADGSDVSVDKEIHDIFDFDMMALQDDDELSSLLRLVGSIDDDNLVLLDTDETLGQVDSLSEETIMIDVMPPSDNVLEESPPNPISLQPFDVVWGRSTALTETHPGNQRFRQLIDRYRKQYRALNRRREKTRIVNEVMRDIASWSGGGRVLKPSQQNGYAVWSLASTEETEEKVRHALRRWD